MSPCHAAPARPRRLGPPAQPLLLRITPEAEPQVQLIGVPRRRPGLPPAAGRPRRWFGRALTVIRHPASGRA